MSGHSQPPVVIVEKIMAGEVEKPSCDATELMWRALSGEGNGKRRKGGRKPASGDRSSCRREDREAEKGSRRGCLL